VGTTWVFCVPYVPYFKAAPFSDASVLPYWQRNKRGANRSRIWGRAKAQVGKRKEKSVSVVLEDLGGRRTGQTNTPPESALAKAAEMVVFCDVYGLYVGEGTLEPSSNLRTEHAGVSTPCARHATTSQSVVTSS
jgi:hypothetical protein